MDIKHQKSSFESTPSTNTYSQLHIKIKSEETKYIQKKLMMSLSAQKIKKKIFQNRMAMQIERLMK